MKVRLLLFGSKGMLGQALVQHFVKDFDLIEASRLECDISDTNRIKPYILKNLPQVVVNCAAIVDINQCEKEKEYAFLINAFAVSKMALACNEIGAKFVQISTDHYYINGEEKKHTEDDYVTILNNYAKTKFVAENYALLSKNNLIIRTNIVGFKNIGNQKTFLNWAIEGIEKKYSLTLFNDYYSSPIDIYSFSEILKKMIIYDLNGLYNVASQNVISKACFVKLLAHKLGISLNRPIFCSIYQSDLNMVRRANTLGLDTNKVEKALSLSMPNTQKVVENIIKAYYEYK